MYMVIDFCTTPDISNTQGCPIDTAVAADLYIILNRYPPNLWNLWW